MNFVKNKNKRFLSYLICDLDVLLLIESQYNSSQLLLNLQKANRINNLNFNNDGSMALDDDNENQVDDEDISDNVKREKYLKKHLLFFEFVFIFIFLLIKSTV